MIFIFDDTTRRQGIWSCRDVNSSGIKRFTPSPLVGTLIRHKTLKSKFNNYDPSKLIIDSHSNRKNYKNIIVPSGVTHSPWDWTGYTDLDKMYDRHMLKRKSVFAYIDKKILGLLKKRKAFLLLDQSHEGYHTDWLFDWFHDCCKLYEIDPDRIIYVTGNLAVETQYEEWCKINQPSYRMCVVPHIHFEEFIYDSAKKQESILPTVDDHLLYKSENADRLKVYNCFQKRPRPHRIWMFYHLYKNGLLNDGINSMNFFVAGNSYYEGKFLTQEECQPFLNILPMYPRNELTSNLKKVFEGPLGGEFERDLYHQETRDTWVSVVSEASYAENTCFISEKTFKPIAARHPFIMCGNKHSLKYLRTLGYKTFDGFIDETYDDLDTWDRYDAIIKEIIKIKNMTHSQRLDWFMSMRDILDHNFQVLTDNTTTVLPNAVLKIQNHVG